MTPKEYFYERIQIAISILFYSIRCIIRQLQIAKDRAIEHLKESKGQTNYFGKALGYSYQMTYHEKIKLDVEIINNT